MAHVTLREKVSSQLQGARPLTPDEASRPHQTSALNYFTGLCTNTALLQFVFNTQAQDCIVNCLCQEIQELLFFSAPLFSTLSLQHIRRCGTISGSMFQALNKDSQGTNVCELCLHAV